MIRFCDVQSSETEGNHDLSADSHTQASHVSGAPPLAHERATILDHYFDDIVTQPIEEYQEYDGRPFMDHLGAMIETPTA
jgi:hypothetical protein